ncbi:hypothetical protein Cni_G26229 [Canna indica]|uniref:Peptidase S8/S53 domain-containing protein n=1 Tax=Canna indica TaxID=4628 RepID=A0AAQ3L1Q5_9LILI|nr:hypothetical protein Cni_G26229 [Canna indica]
MNKKLFFQTLLLLLLLFSTLLLLLLLLYVYDNAIHGFRARVSPSQLEELKRSSGFLSCYRDAPVKKDTTHTSDFLKLSPTVVLWPAENFGDDVIIDVVDTGVWPESVSYRDDGLAPVPSRWWGACEDTDGHGTHTSSSTGESYVGGVSFFGYAHGVASGVELCAWLAMFKALWDEGVVISDIIAAIDHAISDRVDVISLSLGIDDVPLYKDLIAIVAFATIERGIFVSTSMGRRGSSLSEPARSTASSPQPSTSMTDPSS